jgi:selenide,water dikinase
LRPIQAHPASRHPDLLVGTETGDDAGVYLLAPDLGLVQTVDFFTPVVDDAYDWGRIAAANALSDVYAMGGTPLTALQLLAWPREDLSLSLASDVARGGADVMALAECTIVGGHSIDDSEPKYGFAVTGTVHPDRVLTNVGAQSGDVLVLTKPVGTGIISTAIKKGTCPDHVRETAIEVMAELNAHAGLVASEVGASAATDVTGFGLLGHLAEMLVGGIGARIEATSVPVIDGTENLLDAGSYPGGSERNLESVRERLAGGDVRTRRILADAQTSGGLLIAVASDRLPDLLEGLGQAGRGHVIGEVVSDPQGRIVLS